LSCDEENLEPLLGEDITKAGVVFVTKFGEVTDSRNDGDESDSRSAMDGGTRDGR
jgi:hypothetical protein